VESLRNAVDLARLELLSLRNFSTDFRVWAQPKAYASQRGSGRFRILFTSRCRKVLFGDCFSCGNLHGVSGLAEIQEAIEKLAPEERARLLAWLESFDCDLERDCAKEANQTV
jgi:hypothetical protein